MTRGFKHESFLEILELFPLSSVNLHFHTVDFDSNLEFYGYLKNLGFEIITFYYGDFPGWNEHLIGLDVAPYLNSIPLLKVPTQNLENLYVTSQWDSSGEARRISERDIALIKSSYSKLGYKIVTVGGEATLEIHKKSLKEIATLISGATFHIGVDSGFMHLAQLYLPPSNIHIYASPKNFWSHHLFRGLKNGMQLNVYWKKINMVQVYFLKIRYSSKTLLRLWHSLKR
jgi:ADP-heptose:LPS heptosyltransferase